MKLFPKIHLKEIEILSGKSEFGFNVGIKYKDDDAVYEGELVIHYNSTEIHWLYNTELNAKFPKHEPLKVAIESDIHGTGGTREVHRVEYIIVELATQLHSHH